VVALWLGRIVLTENVRVEPALNKGATPNVTTGPLWLNHRRRVWPSTRAQLGPRRRPEPRKKVDGVWVCEPLGLRGGGTLTVLCCAGTRCLQSEKHIMRYRLLTFVRVAQLLQFKLHQQTNIAFKLPLRHLASAPCQGTATTCDAETALQHAIGVMRVVLCVSVVQI
jgi:hypothetical protein